MSGWRTAFSSCPVVSGVVAKPISSAMNLFVTGATPASRREFIKQATVALGATSLGSKGLSEAFPSSKAGQKFEKPLAIASGNGKRSVERAVELMQNGSRVLDAVIEGVNIVEADPNDQSVGYGGLPNAEGTVQLEAGVMDGATHLTGAVAVLEGIRFPSKVARLVMSRTDHARLVGDDAQDFAQMHGFEIENLLTDEARKAWLEWKETLSNDDDYLPPDSVKNTEVGAVPREVRRHHGTIHCSAVDADGNIGSVTSTSGLAFKIPGRVADSSVVGAGLYTDNDVGAAGSTGRGEANLKNLSSYLIVEQMRTGDSPEEACLFACKRIAENTKISRLQDADGRPNFNVRFYAVNKQGEVGGAEMHRSGWSMVVADPSGVQEIGLAHLFK